MQLSTNRAVYSFDDKYDNFATTFKEIITAHFRNKKILLLGGGLGSVPYILEKRADIEADFTIVELDPKIIHLFNRFSAPRLQSKFHLVCQDAVSFVSGCSLTYDMIVIDVFVDDYIPEDIRNTDFLSACAGVLAHDGLLLFNWMITSGQNVANFEDYLNRVFLPIFPEASFIKTKYNRVIISDKKWKRTK